MEGNTQETSIYIENPTTEALESSEENPSTEVSQETPSADIAGPSQINPPSNVDGFYFEFKPAGLLKLAIKALGDPEFNPSGKGRIDVDESFFEITVCNPDNVFGSLSLRGRKLENFQCNRPLAGKLVDLRQISEKLVDFNDEGTVSVLHEDGSNEISFTFAGKEPGRGFAAELLENSVEMPEFPHVEYLSYAKIESCSMSHMIEEMEKTGTPQLVSRDITKNTSTVAVAPDYETLGGASETMGMTERGKRHRAWLTWPYLNMLRTALNLYLFYYVHLISNPPKNMMLNFILQEFGYLRLLKKADESTLNIDSPALLPNWSR